MSMEIKLTDIRGEPPLQVGEFILDKDNNVMYVGSGDFELSKCRGVVDIYAYGKAILIPPNKGISIIDIQDIGEIKTSGAFSNLKTYRYTEQFTINDDSLIGATANFSALPTHTALDNIMINDDNIIKGSGKIVT